MPFQGGFTLLELILVIAILVIIATVGRDFYGSFVSGAQIEANAKTIIYDLRNTRDKAMNGQDDRIWGIHFVNDVSDYYEVFSTPSNYLDQAKTILVTSYLKNGISFSLPTEGANTDIIFSKISGTTTVANINIKAGLTEKSISINDQGLIN